MMLYTIRKGHDVWPSMVIHTRNLCSAFNPSKCTHTAVSSEQTNKHTLTHTPGAVGSHLCCDARGSSWGSGALLKGLTSVVVLRMERALDIHSPTYNPCQTWDSNPQPLGYKSDSLTIRPWLPIHTSSVHPNVIRETKKYCIHYHS